MTSLFACDVASADRSADGARDDLADAPLDVLAGVPTTPELPAAGWIELESSPIVPWCGAVLVAPDVVVTTADCVAGWDAGFLSVGFGSVDDRPRIAIDRVLLQRDAADPELALAAMRLAEPVRGVDPVELASSQLRRTVCGVQSVSYGYVLRGEESSRWSWRGCVEAGAETWIAASDGAPNCHGDLGAGAFLRNGTLLGVVVDARSDGGCSRHERVATVADNEAFFEAALDLSQP